MLTRPLQPIEIFDLTMQSVQQSLGEDTQFIDITVGSQQLARIFVNQGNAHVVYYPGVDTDFTYEPGDIPLKHIVQAVDSVLTEEFKATNKITNINKYLSVGVYDKNVYDKKEKEKHYIAEKHYVTVAVKNDQMISINSKGRDTDPELNYFRNYLPEQVVRTVLKAHTSQQSVLDKNQSGYYVAGNIGILAKKFNDNPASGINKDDVKQSLNDLKLKKVVQTFNKKITTTEPELMIREHEILNIQLDKNIFNKQQKNKSIDTSLSQQKDNYQNAENKVTEGIEFIYATIKNNIKKTDYDKQGIATFSFGPEDIQKLGWGKYFPQAMSNGVVIHLYRDKLAKQVLPMRSMVEGKIKSLCEAAAILNPNQRMNIESIQAVLIQDFEDKFAKEKNLTNENLEKWMDDYSNLSVLSLYENEKKENKELNFKSFVKNIIQESTHHRTSKQDILTFDEDAKRFSYDHVMPETTTAHDRLIGNPPANLGTTFDGKFDDNNHFTITSSVTHHASLAPIGSFATNKDKLAILIDTCNRLEQTALYLSDLQKLGNPNAKEINVDWCYQLLTTNILNSENQRDSYDYIAQAVDLMGQSHFENNNTAVNLQMSLMNVGVNKLGSKDKYYNIFDDNQERHNRKAYQHLTTSLSSLVIPNVLTQQNDIAKLHDWLTLHVYEYQDEYEKCLADIKSNNLKFNEARATYNITTSGEDSLRTVTKNKLNTIIENSDALNKQLDDITKKIEDKRRERWKHYQPDVKNLLSTIRSQIVTSSSTEEILYLSSLFFKAYMDDLYYSEEYRKPEKAALFNAYTSAYQRLIGMMPTTGCKSGNDRTYAARLIIAVLEGRDLEAVPLPPDYHENKDAYDNFKYDLSKIALSNSNLYTPIYDTTTAPKIKSSNFNIFSQKRPKIHLMPSNKNDRDKNKFYMGCKANVYFTQGYTDYLTRKKFENPDVNHFTAWAIENKISDANSYICMLPGQDNKNPKLVLYRNEANKWVEHEIANNFNPHVANDLKLWKSIRSASVNDLIIPIVNTKPLKKYISDSDLYNQIKPTVEYCMGRGEIQNDAYSPIGNVNDSLYDAIVDKVLRGKSKLAFTEKEQDKIFAYTDKRGHTRHLPTLVDRLFTFGKRFAPHKMKANKIKITDNIKKWSSKVLEEARNNPVTAEQFSKPKQFSYAVSDAMLSVEQKETLQREEQLQQLILNTNDEEHIESEDRRLAQLEDQIKIDRLLYRVLEIQRKEGFWDIRTNLIETTLRDEYNEETAIISDQVELFNRKRKEIVQSLDKIQDAELIKQLNNLQPDSPTAKDNWEYNFKIENYLALRGDDNALKNNLEQLKEIGHRIYLDQIKLVEDNSRFSKENFDKTFGDRRYDDLRAYFKEWLDTLSESERKDILSIGRSGKNMFSIGKSSHLELDKNDVSTLNDLSHAITQSISQNNQVNPEKLNKNLNSLGIVKKGKVLLKDDAQYVEDDTLISRVLKDKSTDSYWLDHSDLNKIITFLNKDKSPEEKDLVYVVPSAANLANQLAEQIENIGNKGTFYILLNNADSAYQAGSHWTTAKIEIDHVNNQISISYADSQKGNFPPNLEPQIRNLFANKYNHYKIVPKVENDCVAQRSFYECGYLSLYQLSKWLGRPLINFNKSNYYSSMNKLTSFIQKGVLSQSVYNESGFAKYIDDNSHANKFERISANGDFRLTQAFLDKKYNLSREEDVFAFDRNNAIPQEPLVTKPVVNIVDEIEKIVTEVKPIHMQEHKTIINHLIEKKGKESHRILSKQLINEILTNCRSDEEKIRILEIFSHSLDGVSTKLKKAVDDTLNNLEKQCPYSPLNSNDRQFTKNHASVFLRHLLKYEKDQPSSKADSDYFKHLDYAYQLTKDLLLCKTQEDLIKIKHTVEEMSKDQSIKRSHKNLSSLFAEMAVDIDKRLKYFPSAAEVVNITIDTEKGQRLNPAGMAIWDVYVHNSLKADTLLIQLAKAIPKDSSESSIISRCAMIKMLCDSRNENDRSLGYTLLHHVTPEYVEYARHHKPTYYYAQKSSTFLTLLNNANNKDQNIINKLDQKIKEIFNQFFDPSSHLTMRDLSNALTSLLKDYNNFTPPQKETVKFLQNFINDIKKLDRSHQSSESMIFSQLTTPLTKEDELFRSLINASMEKADVDKRDYSRIFQNVISLGSGEKDHKVDKKQRDESQKAFIQFIKSGNFGFKNEKDISNTLAKIKKKKYEDIDKMTDYFEKNVIPLFEKSSISIDDIYPHLLYLIKSTTQPLHDRCVQAHVTMHGEKGLEKKSADPQSALEAGYVLSVFQGVLDKFSRLGYGDNQPALYNKLRNFNTVLMSCTAYVKERPVEGSVSPGLTSKFEATLNNEANTKLLYDAMMKKANVQAASEQLGIKMPQPEPEIKHDSTIPTPEIVEEDQQNLEIGKINHH